MDAIKHHYIFEMFVDGLPVKGFVGEMESKVAHADLSNHVVKAEDNRIFLFTHLDFSIAYNNEHIIGGSY